MRRFARTSRSPSIRSEDGLRPRSNQRASATIRAPTQPSELGKATLELFLLAWVPPHGTLSSHVIGISNAGRVAGCVHSPIPSAGFRPYGRVILLRQQPAGMIAVQGECHVLALFAGERTQARMIFDDALLQAQGRSELVPKQRDRGLCVDGPVPGIRSRLARRHLHEADMAAAVLSRFVRP